MTNDLRLGGSVFTQSGVGRRMINTVFFKVGLALGIVLGGVLMVASPLLL